MNVSLAITPGDLDGIGLEISLKALRRLSKVEQKQIALYVHSSQLALKSVRSLIEATSCTVRVRDTKPAQWVVEAAKLCMASELGGLVTGPLSKVEIRSSRVGKMGHTEILSKVSGVKNLCMGFVGSEFSVVLATGHIPLSRVPTSLNRSMIANGCRFASALAKLSGRQKLPIAVLGLNPHAGESGMIGKEETRIRAWIAKEVRAGRNLVGPLSPDGSFLPTVRTKYGAFLCMYHDQGLLPFKAVHGVSGVHVTLGLPFIRTSVDHGTAKDIFGKNIADETSMFEAIRLGFQLKKMGGLYA